MAALMAAADEGGAESVQLREVLDWVSPAEHHEISDEGARGRLITLFRALDGGGGVKDGRVGVTDILDASERHAHGHGKESGDKKRRGVKGTMKAVAIAVRGVRQRR